MSPLLISLAAGVLIGLIYALFNVRSPAPPAVALVGLLGMIIGSTLGSKFAHADHAAVDGKNHTQITTVLPPQTKIPNVKQAG